MTTPPIGVEVGRKVTLTNTVTEKDITTFAEVSGDDNPLHLQDDYAKQTRFQQRIAHGILSVSYISAALVKLPDPNVTVVYLGHNHRFRRPVNIGDTVTTELEVAEIDTERRRVKLNSVCTNQDGEQLVTGEVEIMLDPFPFPG